jgi:hypothetical protein
VALGSEDPDRKTPLEGRYANYFKVGHNRFEFVLEFGQLYQGEEIPRMHTRIVTSPTYAREFMATLGQALDQHERDNRDDDSGD